MAWKFYINTTHFAIGCVYLISIFVFVTIMSCAGWRGASPRNARSA